MEDKPNPNVNPNPPLPTQENEKIITSITSRRSRKDEEGRDFQCGCGKRYLSYPALYTHIKTKHEGKQPEGTQKTGTTITAKRTKLKLEDETLKIIDTYFSEFESDAVNQLGDIVRGHISLGSRIKKEGVGKQIYEHYLHLVKQPTQFKLTEQSTLELALIVFLAKMGDLVNDKVYDQFLLFARLARACYYEHGEEIYKVMFAKKGEGPFQLKQFNLHQVKYFPIITDFFIRFYIPQTESRDAREANLSLTQVIIYDFCRWLRSNKFTNIKVAMSKKTVIDFKPPATVIKTKNTPGKIELQKENDEKQNKEDHENDHEGSEEVSQAEQIEEEVEREEKNPSGSKDLEEA